MDGLKYVFIYSFMWAVGSVWVQFRFITGPPLNLIQSEKALYSLKKSKKHTQKLYKWQ